MNYSSCGTRTIKLSVLSEFEEPFVFDERSVLDKFLAKCNDIRVFMNRDDLYEWDSNVTSNDPIPGSVKIGVLLLLQANYQATPDEADKLRRSAEIKLMPYRIELGV